MALYGSDAIWGSDRDENCDETVKDGVGTRGVKPEGILLLLKAAANMGS